MKISCNKLKTHIKNSDSIDWIKIWETFTIRTAEVEGVEIKGADIKDVVVGKILECNNHPTKEKYHVLKVDNGEEVVDILCGAPNVRENLKVAIVKVNGSIGGFVIEPKKIAGVLSQGMLCSAKELGIGEDHDGILEFPEEWIVGTDVKEYIPLDDVIVEIDNKSLTNRPDLWGHYGIAREIAAITKNKLIPLELADIPNNSDDLKISIKDSTNCLRYMGIKLDNIVNNKTPYDIQTFLHYAGMRSISLLVDLTNYVMLELGQPMHAFDARSIKKLEIGKARKNDTFVTLDGVSRTLSNEMLMIKNNNEYFAIAGIMGGETSEILADTTSIVLESATFDATSVRKTATSLGLRTEASARYEKSLDSNMTSIAAKRFIKLLMDENKELVFASNLTDCYPTKLEEKEIILTKEKLSVYMGQVLKDSLVKEILESLEFSVSVLKDSYKVIVPTFRATKDISLPEDLIEEIARMYGYENFELEPLKLDLTFVQHEDIHDREYEIKKYLASKYSLNEVHTYLWNKSGNLNRFGIELDNISLLGRVEDNILRNDLGLSLIEVAKENLKYSVNLGIFELGTIVEDNKNKRSLSILLAENIDNVENLYYQAKMIAFDIFKTFLKLEIEFEKVQSYEYYNNDYSYAITDGKHELGVITLVSSKVAREVAKKTAIAVINIDFNQLLELDVKKHVYEEISKYPNVTLDYTIITGVNARYSVVEDVIKSFKNEFIKTYELVDIYVGNEEKRVTIRFVIGSYSKTLSQEDIASFQKKFIKYVKEKGLSIVE